MSDPSFERTNLTLLVDVGARDEARGEAGFSQLLVRQSDVDSWVSGDLRQDVEVSAQGATRSGFAELDGLGFDYILRSHTIPTPALELAIWELKAAREQNPLAARNGAEDERRHWIENSPLPKLSQRKPERVRFLATLLADSTYARTLENAFHDVEAASVEGFSSFASRLDQPDRWLVVVAGPLDPQHVFDLAERHLGRLPASRATVHVAPTQSEPRSPRVSKQRILRPTGERARSVSAGWPGLAARDRDRDALDVLIRVLGRRRPANMGEFAGRWSWSHHSLREAGFVELRIEADEPVAVEVLEGRLRRLLSEIVANPITPEETKAVVEVRRRERLEWMKSPAGRATALAVGLAVHGDPDWAGKKLRSDRSLTASELNRVLETYLPCDHCADERPQTLRE